jgi:predicted dehydrogenase
MKQVVQSFKTGKLAVLDVPAPLVEPNGILVRTVASLVSTGTERMTVNLAKRNLLQKARTRPDLVRVTRDKARSDGLLMTFRAARSRLNQLTPLGYSSAGIVVRVGTGAEFFQVGDRVACGGAGFACHAQAVFVPKNLAVKLSDNIHFDEAAFATIGAIALQGVRLSKVTIGDVVGVIGLGLIGQLAIQVLKAAGCTTVGIDPKPVRAELALALGADAVATETTQFRALIERLSNGHGADAVLIAADTKSNEPVELAGTVARKKGTIVAVGAVGTRIPRKAYYEKELDFRISMSYGPGRYDPMYERAGIDYPYAYVRWTEQRNMEAFTQMLSRGRINVSPLITHRFDIDDAAAAYDLIGKTNEPFLAVILTFPEPRAPGATVGPSETRYAQREIYTADKDATEVSLGVLGAGRFATSTLLPALRGIPQLRLVGIASAGGLTAVDAGNRFGFLYSSSAEDILRDKNINTIAITTRHNLHAAQVVAALKAGKNVFVEKPLCLTSTELRDISETYLRYNNVNGSRSMLAVGFNRRFAPFIVELKEHIGSVSDPVVITCRVNAGRLSSDHWIHDVGIGGGRLIAEGCHFIDLLIHLAGSLPRRVFTRTLPGAGQYTNENVVVGLDFANGSIGLLTYVSNGDKGLGKELIEVFGGGLSASTEDYRTLHIRHGKTVVRRTARFYHDKGHRAEWQAIVAHLLHKTRAPISFDEVLITTRTTFAAEESLLTGQSIEIE